MRRPKVRVWTDGTPQNTRVRLKVGRRWVDVTNACTMVQKDKDHPVVRVELISFADKSEYGREFEVSV